MRLPSTKGEPETARLEAWEGEEIAVYIARIAGGQGYRGARADSGRGWRGTREGGIQES